MSNLIPLVSVILYFSRMKSNKNPVFGWWYIFVSQPNGRHLCRQHYNSL